MGKEVMMGNGQKKKTGSTEVLFIHGFFLPRFQIEIFSLSKCRRWSLESFYSDMKEPVATSREQVRGKTTY